MTARLFDDDSHLLVFEASVLSCEPTSEGFFVRLDATAFAPEGGGQPSDIGRLGGVSVLSVSERDGEIYHLTDAPLGEGARVTGEVDRVRRLRHLQNHTGEHIVTGLFFREYGMNNVGFHLGHEDVTLDLDGSVDMAMLRRIEYMANLAVAENRAVRVLYPTQEELCKLAYRSKGEIKGRVRLVEIEGLDLCACCVPHVKRTGEVGGIRLLGAMRYKGGTRIHMKCGLDALAHSNVQQDRENELSRLLSLPSDRLVTGVKKLTENLAAAKYKLVQMKREKIREYLETLDCEARRLCLFEKDFEVSELRMLALGAVEKTGGLCAAFSGDDEGGYRFVLAELGDGFAETVTLMKEALGASGGGKAPCWQGTLSASAAQILDFFDSRN